VGKWLAGIVAAVISGLIVIYLATQIWPDPDVTSTTDGRADPSDPPVEVEGSRLVVIPGVHITPEAAGSLRWVEMAVDLDTGQRDDGPGGDVAVAIDYDEEASWLKADEAAEVGGSPSYQECVAALSGAGEYVQPFVGRPTICVRTGEGRIAWFQMGELTLFPDADPDFYTIEAPFDFRTWR
jgi:hypothetical protein